MCDITSQKPGIIWVTKNALTRRYQPTRLRAIDLWKKQDWWKIKKKVKKWEIRHNKTNRLHCLWDFNATQEKKIFTILHWYYVKLSNKDLKTLFYSNAIWL